VSLEDLVRAALAEEAKAEPGEDGAYERFLRRRRRGALAVAGSTGLAVALVLAVAIGGAMVAGGGRSQEGAGSPVASVTTPPTTPPSTPATQQPPGPVETTLPPHRRCPSPPTGWSAGSARGSS
jgi:hypothetical protein